MTIEEILNDESLRLDCYIYKGEPFKFLDYVNKEYFDNYFEPIVLYNRTLDIYNYYKRNGVHHETKRISLHQTFRQMLKESYGEQGNEHR